MGNRPGHARLSFILAWMVISFVCPFSRAEYTYRGDLSFSSYYPSLSTNFSSSATNGAESPASFDFGNSEGRVAANVSYVRTVISNSIFTSAGVTATANGYHYDGSQQYESASAQGEMVWSERILAQLTDPGADPATNTAGGTWRMIFLVAGTVHFSDHSPDFATYSLGFPGKTSPEAGTNFQPLFSATDFTGYTSNFQTVWIGDPVSFSFSTPQIFNYNLNAFAQKRNFQKWIGAGSVDITVPARLIGVTDVLDDNGNPIPAGNIILTSVGLDNLPVAYMPVQYMSNGVTTFQQPLLSASCNGNTLSLSWPLSFGDFTLQYTDDLSGNTWTAVTNMPSVSAQDIKVDLGLTEPKRFYRLKW